MYIEEKWINSFGKDVSINDINQFVVGSENYLWHIFSFKLVKCIEGKEAEKMFKNFMFKESIVFSENNGKIKLINKNQLFDYDDIYITDKNFRWTYVKTHESDCGPYFCSLD